MFRRIAIFAIFELAGGVAGWLATHDPVAALAMALCGGLVWFTLDLLRGIRVLAWLRLGNAADAPVLGGMWGEIADRTRRALRSREQQLKDSEARLQEFLAAIQASPNGLVLLDTHGRIEWYNQTAATQFGFEAQRDLLQQIGNLVRDPAFSAYYNSGDYDAGILIAGRESTASRPVKLAVHLHAYGEGHKLLLARDVTALEQADTMRRDFVANVSHEIRTPLTVLGGFVETLQTLPLNEQERQRYLGMMAQQAQRMQTLVSDLLMLSRLEGSPPPRHDEWVSVKGLMAQCEQDARELSAMLASESHRLRFDLLDDGEIAGAPSELLSAMTNLVSNAVRYTPAGGAIDVSWQLLPDGRASFAVKDTGPGIAPEHLSRLTERFYRVDRSRSRETGGTGLGLAIVKHVAQRHGAELRIESTPGAGSTFSMLFPAARLRPRVTPALLTTPVPPSSATSAQPATEES